MGTSELSQASPFEILFCMFQEMSGSIRDQGRYPWAEDVPEAFVQLKLLIRDTFLVMGPTTFQAFCNCKQGRELLLYNTRHTCFILTKKKDFSQPKGYPVVVIKSLKQLSDIWLATYVLEKIKQEETRKSRNLQIQKLIQKGTITPQDIYVVKTEPHLERKVIAIGGPLLYKRILPYAKSIHMFLICENFPGDTILPPIDQKLWEQDSNAYRDYKPNEKNKHTLLHVTWNRKNRPPQILL